VPSLAIGAPGHGVACWLHDRDAMSREGRPVGIPRNEEAAP